MRLHGGLAEVEALRDLGVGEPLGEEAQHLELAVGEGGDARVGRDRGDRRGGGCVGGSAAEALDDPARDVRREQRVAARDHVHGLHERLRRRALQHEAARARVERGEEVVLAVEGREHEDTGRDRGVRHDAARGLEPVDARHLHVHADHVGRERRGQAHALLAVGGLADHLDAVLALEDHADAGAHERLVVDEEDADGRGRGGCGCGRGGRLGAHARVSSGVGAGIDASSGTGIGTGGTTGARPVGTEARTR